MSEIVDRIWPELQQAICLQPPDPNGGYRVWSGVRKFDRDPNEWNNTVEVFTDHVYRRAQKGEGVRREIHSVDFINFAREAIEHDAHRFCINDEGIEKGRYVKAGRMGSFVCSCLALLPYFEYVEGQYLVFFSDRV